MIRKIVLYWIVFSTISLQAQEGRFTSMGNASVMIHDFWSVFGNQAGIAQIDAIEVGASYYQSYQIWELGTQNFGMVLPTKSGNFAASFQRTGYSKFSKNSTGITFARKLGDKWSASVQFDYLFFHQTEQTKDNGAFLIETGLITEPVKGLFIGAHVFNPTHARISDLQDEKLPTLFRIGLGYYFSHLVLVNIETEKDLEYKPRLKFGVEYQVVKNFFARLGLKTQPNQFSTGLGYKVKNLTTDIAFVTHETLPVSTQISMKYQFK